MSNTASKMRENCRVVTSGNAVGVKKKLAATRCLFKRKAALTYKKLWEVAMRVEKVFGN